MAVLGGTLSHFKMLPKVLPDDTPVSSRVRVRVKKPPLKLEIDCTGISPNGRSVPTFMFISPRENLGRLTKKGVLPNIEKCEFLTPEVCDEITRQMNSEEFNEKLISEFPALKEDYLEFDHTDMGYGLKTKKPIPFVDGVGMVLSLYTGLYFETPPEFEAVLKNIPSDRVITTEGSLLNDDEGRPVSYLTKTLQRELDYKSRTRFKFHVFGHQMPVGFVSSEKLLSLGFSQETVDRLSREMLPPTALAAGFVNHRCGRNDFVLDKVHFKFTALGSVYNICGIALINVEEVGAAECVTVGYGDDISTQSHFHTLPDVVKYDIFRNSTCKTETLDIIKKHGIKDFKDGYVSNKILNRKENIRCMCDPCVELFNRRLLPSKFFFQKNAIDLGFFMKCLPDGFLEACTLRPEDILSKKPDVILHKPCDESDSDDSNSSGCVSSFSSSNSCGGYVKDECGNLMVLNRDAHSVGSASKELVSDNEDEIFFADDGPTVGDLLCASAESDSGYDCTRVESVDDRNCTRVESAGGHAAPHARVDDTGCVGVDNGVVYDAGMAARLSQGGIPREVTRDKGAAAAVGAAKGGVWGSSECAVNFPEGKPVKRDGLSCRQILTEFGCEKFKQRRNNYLKQQRREQELLLLEAARKHLNQNLSRNLTAANVTAVNNQSVRQVHNAPHDIMQALQVSNSHGNQDCERLVYSVRSPPRELPDPLKSPNQSQTLGLFPSIFNDPISNDRVLSPFGDSSMNPLSGLFADPPASQTRQSVLFAYPLHQSPHQDMSLDGSPARSLSSQRMSLSPGLDNQCGSGTVSNEDPMNESWFAKNWLESP